jgi:hypothetical protein
MLFFSRDFSSMNIVDGDDDADEADCHPAVPTWRASDTPIGDQFEDSQATQVRVLFFFLFFFFF